MMERSSESRASSARKPPAPSGVRYRVSPTAVRGKIDAVESRPAPSSFSLVNAFDTRSLPSRLTPQLAQADDLDKRRPAGSSTDRDRSSLAQALEDDRGRRRGGGRGHSRRAAAC